MSVAPVIKMIKWDNNNDFSLSLSSSSTSSISHYLDYRRECYNQRFILISFHFPKAEGWLIIKCFVKLLWLNVMNNALIFRWFPTTNEKRYNIVYDWINLLLHIWHLKILVDFSWENMQWRNFLFRYNFFSLFSTNKMAVMFVFFNLVTSCFSSNMFNNLDEKVSK